MPFEPDAVLARRSLKQQLFVWRVIGVVALVAAIVVTIGRLNNGLAYKRDYLARYTIDGIITEDLQRDAALSALARDDSVKGLLVHVNSPGGTVVGGEDLYTVLRDVAEEKPVVAILGTLATSAGYMTAVAADRIYAREGTVTGSIGVMFQSTEFTGLMEKLGISAEAIKSSPLKAQPSPLEPLTDEARAATQELVMDIYQFFLDLVADRRGLNDTEVRTLGDGRVYTGRQALRNGLIDAIGNESAAIDWLREERDVTRNLTIRDVVVHRDGQLWRNWISALTEKTMYSEALTLDGLVSIWHP